MCPLTDCSFDSFDFNVATDGQFSFCVCLTVDMFKVQYKAEQLSLLFSILNIKQALGRVLGVFM